MPPPRLLLFLFSFKVQWKCTAFLNFDYDVKVKIFINCSSMYLKPYSKSLFKENVRVILAIDCPSFCIKLHVIATNEEKGKPLTRNNKTLAKNENYKIHIFAVEFFCYYFILFCIFMAACMCIMHDDNPAKFK